MCIAKAAERRDFEKLGRLLLINEAWLIENCLKLPLLITMSRGSQRWQQNSFRIRSARVTIAIDTQKRFPLSRETQARRRSIVV